ncbi:MULTISPECIES: ATP-binding protein [unclassified Coleofasciculus]|uniref:ATP-binding protein n=1 Tax=unclassified Coleofasciculus TaxID=2692782 RepID=UPI001882485D|nr:MULTISPECIES: ATP-binding protein [unclassified Coleofasciculus]MBE9125096.1 ATP-binding protein [Coleofasciculus sp. LEGE 07081]MBE9150099.1 ATP-binding protein [Coleofasciculus sp. LEGE 07092]
MQNEEPIKQSCLQVETDLNAVKEVLQWFEQFVSPRWPKDFWWGCQVALEEGFTNAVRHAHRHLPPTTPIELELKVFANRLEMRIWDRGEPFDLLTKLQVLCQEKCNPLEKEDGRGLIFMYRFTDELSYQRLSDQRNCLLMLKWC